MLGNHFFEVTDSDAQKFDHVLKGVVEVLLFGMPVTRLQVRKPMKCAPEGAGCMNPIVLGQVERYERLAQRVHDPVDRGF